MTDFKLYIVGGFVRDQILGIKSKDVDFSFEFSSEFLQANIDETPEWFYDRMNDRLEEEGFEIFKKHFDSFITKAKFPKGHKHDGLAADFVMCRKEVYLDPKSRAATVSMGTLYDDLYRRDFTVNAIAIDENDNIIDPFGGQKDLESMQLRCPKDAVYSFSEDYLRMIRAIRFHITRGFSFSIDVHTALLNSDNWKNLSDHVSTERVRAELEKCFKHDTIKTLKVLVQLNPYEDTLLNAIFTNDLWLKPTTEKK